MKVLVKREGFNMNTKARQFAVASFIVFTLCSFSTSQSAKPLQSDAGALVNELRDLPTPLPVSTRSDRSIPTVEQQRRRLYESLLHMGPKAVIALSHALRDSDLHLRRNAALALNVLGGGWYDSSWPTLDIRPALPALIAALQDDDSNVRAWSAQAIGNIGPDAVKAVPNLIMLLTSSDGGSRNSACIALRFIGPPAKQALPALKKLLSDPSKDTRTFAAQAIENIER
jgi:HEAT repeat protein